MRKTLSLSALLSTLLAGPVFAGPPAPVADQAPSRTAPSQERADAVPVDHALPPFPVEMPPELQDRFRQLMEGRPLDANGMQALHRRMTRDMQDHLQRILASAPGRVEMAPGGQGMQLMRSAAETEKAAFLGVTTSTVTASLRQQLKLQRGVGLVVDFVEKDSPAAAAGVKLYDILEKLDDQILVNPQQLAVLVRGRKPGDSVNLSVIREGQRTTVTAKLAGKDMPVLESVEPNQFLKISPDFPGFNGNAPQLRLLPGGAAPDWLQIIPGDGAWQKSTRMSVTADADGNVTRTLTDGQHEITLKTTKDGQKTLIAKDHAGTELYNGPYTTDGKNEKVPAEVLDKVRTMEKTGKVIIKNGAPGEAGAEPMTLTRVDADHEITVRVDSRGRMATVKDVKSGQTLFDGPANSDADLKGLPPGVGEKVKALIAKTGPAR